MIDFEKIKTLYRLGRDLGLSDVQSLYKAATIKSFALGEYIVEEGGTKKEIFLIRKGLVRVFQVNVKGDEITTLIRSENQIVGSPYILLFDQPSKAYIEALEATEVFAMDYDVLESIVSENPKLEANRKYFLQYILKEQIQRLNSFMLLSPEERYIEFVANNPRIINRAPNKYIANILGVTPVSLSRIRKRISEKKK